MSDDEILFDDIYELHEVIGERASPWHLPAFDRKPIQLSTNRREKRRHHAIAKYRGTILSFNKKLGGNTQPPSTHETISRDIAVARWMSDFALNVSGGVKTHLGLKNWQHSALNQKLF